MKPRWGQAIPNVTSEFKKAPTGWPMYSLVCTVAIGCYLNGLNGDFVHDDIPAVTLNKDVLATNGITNILKNDFWGTPMADVSSHKSYRPLTILTFRVNYLCFGLKPLWFHITNIGLHATACLLFTRVCLYIADLKPPFATLAGLLFAVHPIHTEAVTGIVGRADVLACVFFLISLLAYHGQEDGNCYVWTSVVLGGLSMLAKETGITVFLLNLAYDTYKTWPNIKKTVVEVRWTLETKQFANRSVKVLTSLGLLLAIRLSLLQGSLPKFSQQDNPAAFHPSFYVRILTFCYLAAFNWWLLLCPITLSHDWQMGSIPLITTLSDTRNLITCLFICLAMTLAIKCLSDFEGQRHITLVLGLLLLILPFLPATNLVVTVGFVVAERVLYIPSLGCVLLIVYGVQLFWTSSIRHRQAIMCFVLLILLANCFRTIIRNRDWKSRETLLRAGLHTLPHNAKMHYNFGNFLRDSQKPELAKSHYKIALRLWPTYASAHNNLGTLITSEGEAEQHFLLAIKYSAEHVNAHYNLGQLYRKNNQSSKSELMLKRCIRLEPSFTPAYIELARLRGPHDRDVGSLLRRVVELNPLDPNYSTIYAHWLLDKGNNMFALKYYWNALSASPSYLEALMGASRILRKLGNKSRIFQLVTRWQSILRVRKGEHHLSAHIYLHGWQLKNELRNKAKAYEPCTTGLYNGKCVEHVPREPINYSTGQAASSTYKWTSCNRTNLRYSSSLSAQCRKHRPTTPLMIHNLLDIV